MSESVGVEPSSSVGVWFALVLRLPWLFLGYVLFCRFEFSFWYLLLVWGVVAGSSAALRGLERGRGGVALVEERSVWVSRRSA